MLAKFQVSVCPAFATMSMGMQTFIVLSEQLVSLYTAPTTGGILIPRTWLGAKNVHCVSEQVSKRKSVNWAVSLGQQTVGGIDSQSLSFYEN